MANVKMLKMMIENKDENLYVVMKDANDYDVLYPFNGVGIEEVEKDGEMVKALVLTPYVPIKKADEGIRESILIMAVGMIVECKNCGESYDEGKGIHICSEWRVEHKKACDFITLQGYGTRFNQYLDMDSIIDLLINYKNRK